MKISQKKDEVLSRVQWVTTKSWRSTGVDCPAPLSRVAQRVIPHNPQERLSPFVATWVKADPEADALTARLGYLCWRPG